MKQRLSLKKEEIQRQEAYVNFMAWSVVLRKVGPWAEKPTSPPIFASHVLQAHTASITSLYY